MKIDREKFLESLIKRLDEIDQTPKSHNSVPVEKLILYLVDRARRDKYEGIISIKIKDTEIYPPREEETTALNREYVFIEKST